jgi:signal transduction histidine kinase
VTANSPEGLWLILAFAVVSYSVSAYSARRRGLVGLAVVLAGYGLYAWGDRGVRDWDSGDAWATGFFGILIVACWLLGMYLRHRRDERVSRARAEELEERARTAVDQERARLARELHDVVSHNLSVVVVQAAGARAARTGDPATLEKIERSGREALVEMRRMLGVLRQENDGGDDSAPQPGIAQLDALAAGIRAIGVPVTLTVEGDPTGLPTVMELCIYRIVQESLTNVVKHAVPCRATVRVRCDPNAVTVEVRDDGTAVRTKGSGHGLIGMRERVALFNGELTAGPLGEGGFAVHARLPRDPAP